MMCALDQHRISLQKSSSPAMITILHLTFSSVIMRSAAAAENVTVALPPGTTRTRSKFLKD
jgi:hypothetical protein